MTKRSIGVIRPCLIGLFFTLIFCLAFCAFAFAETIQVVAPSGDKPYTFETDLSADVLDAPYAGVQFTLTISDEKAIKFDGFELSSVLRTKNAQTLSPTTKNDSYIFGFMTGRNDGTNEFEGSVVAGKVKFTYSGSAPAVITLTEMKVARIVQVTVNGVD
ncbi:MAG: hypothetical protein FWG42_09615, partial [Clostridiales bacterium]|nr:hypothetical protein [Clostridiales bacterium]